jgi:hypothetical protein
MNLQAAQDEMRGRVVSAETRQVKVRGRGPGAPPLVMPIGDPLYEMLPTWDLVSRVKWHKRKPYELPPNLKSTGVQESLKISAATIIKQFLFDERRSQCDRQGRNRFLQILVNLTAIASKPGPQSIAAATLLFDRGLGKVRPSDEELEANKNRGYKIIMVSPIHNDIPVEKEQAALPPAPEFLEAEFGGRE